MTDIVSELLDRALPSTKVASGTCVDEDAVLDTMSRAADVITRLDEVNSKLRKTLEYYAETACEGWCDGGPAVFGRDCFGCPARAALFETARRDA